jgi:transcriptional regulator with XRE-family HTH domain
MTPADFTAARKSLGLTQEQWGERLGLHRVTVTNIETGRAPITPTVEHLVKLYKSEAKSAERIVELEKLLHALIHHPSSIPTRLAAQEAISGLKTGPGQNLGDGE